MSDLTANEVDALLEALRTTTADTGGEGATVGELAEKMGCNVQTVRGRLRRLIGENRAIPVRVRRLRLDGILQTVSGYKIVS